MVFEAKPVKLCVIHNDVSAGNVLLRPDDGGFCLIDWGRAYLDLRV
ncbi:BZ3500_MvSof-1268-A1-R1_Chr9g10812 [Microbotryum saponariae]|uniref:BZ3500_MvSof-1268-A1-R1_Chr9g10812 protein n=1 Tax=Microbotryum saponariae TaxID=289078 RepID=A0A2X0N7D3_9BASI|nr:BZ3501_MvSof-1269-A2-R1_Chr9g10560 [Microbotryum saponariae]SDA00737.1 BZ3500_MvSof-1268-A1-R1_Chr9g10812 [Microbotryum saponariae]